MANHYQVVLSYQYDSSSPPTGQQTLNMALVELTNGPTLVPPAGPSGSPAYTFDSGDRFEFVIFDLSSSGVPPTLPPNWLTGVTSGGDQLFSGIGPNPNVAYAGPQPNVAFNSSQPYPCYVVGTDANTPTIATAGPAATYPNVTFTINVGNATYVDDPDMIVKP